MNPKRIIGEPIHKLTPWLDRALYIVNRPTGSEVTLSEAVGSGFTYQLVVGQAVTENEVVIKTSKAGEVFAGQAVGVVAAAAGWATEDDTNTITLDGSTTGGLPGDILWIIDIAPGVWMVDARLKDASATPFSAVVYPTV